MWNSVCKNYFPAKKHYTTDEMIHIVEPTQGGEKIVASLNTERGMTMKGADIPMDTYTCLKKAEDDFKSWEVDARFKA